MIFLAKNTNLSICFFAFFFLAFPSFSLKKKKEKSMKQIEYGIPNFNIKSYKNLQHTINIINNKSLEETQFLV